MEETFFIPTYVINLQNRKDRLIHIKNQFKNRKEFKVKIIEAVEHPVGRMGLWHSIVKIINLAKKNEDDVIIICEDDHEFTSFYNSEKLIQYIMNANKKGVDFLNGGIGGCQNAIPVSENFFWVDTFWCTQFLIIFRKFFDAILDEPFKITDTADGKLSTMTSNKLVLYPFISLQKNFGYSDVTASNNTNNATITQLFEDTDARFKAIQSIYQFYQKSNT